MALDVSPLKRFIEGVAGDPSPEVLLWQIGVAAAAVALGYFTARVVCREVQPSPRWKFGEGDFERVAYPLFTYLFVVAGKLILERHQRVSLLEILQSLLVAWIVIRIAVYVLGHILPKGGFLRGSIRTVAWIAWIGVALYLTGLLPGTIEALDDVGFSLGKDRQKLSLWLLMQALAALALALTLAAWISSVTESRVLAAQHLEMSTRVVVTKLVRVVTIFLAVLIALPMVGIDITALSVFGGALGVGLGFGLQKIAANYVSGFIVLLDHSLRIGDVITVDNKRGKVKAIESRYTVLRALDGSEAIIPNEMLISQSVLHHTFTDPKAAISFEVSVSYESDVERACEVLESIARAHPGLIDDPAPAARVKQLSESGIDLQLAAWVADAGEGEGELRSDIFKAILREFRAASIDIPYPRRDVRLVATPETPNPAAISTT